MGGQAGEHNPLVYPLKKSIRLLQFFHANSSQDRFSGGALRLNGFGLSDCVAAIGEHARYDERRLRIYAARETNAENIAVRRFGRAVAMRFSSVGYFNQVYHFDVAAVSRLGEVESFYAGLGFRPKIYVAPDTDRPWVMARLRDAGYEPNHSMVRLARSVSEPVSTECSDTEVRVLDPANVAPYFDLYLDAFGADPDPLKRSEAVANMSLLIQDPELWFYEVKWQGESAGIGILQCTGQQASLCGGATKQAYRGQGVHRALIAKRILQAQALGAERISSWAETDGESHQNLARMGFRLLYEDVVWQRPVRTA